MTARLRWGLIVAKRGKGGHVSDALTINSAPRPRSIQSFAGGTLSANRDAARERIRITWTALRLFTEKAAASTRCSRSGARAVCCSAASPSRQNDQTASDTSRCARGS